MILMILDDPRWSSMILNDQTDQMEEKKTKGRGGVIQAKSLRILCKRVRVSIVISISSSKILILEKKILIIDTKILVLEKKS